MIVTRNTLPIMLKIDDQEELRIFLEELYESLSFLDNSILALEENPEDREQLTDIFRVAHTVKGNAGFLDLKNLVDLGHAMESVFQQLQKANSPINREVIDTLFACKDAIAEIGHLLKENKNPESVSTDHLIQRVNAILHAGENVASSTGTAESAGSSAIKQSALPDLQGEYIEDATLIRVWISPHEVAPSIRAFLVHQKITEFAEILAEYPSEEQRDEAEFANSDRELRFWVKTQIPKNEIPDHVSIDLIERIEALDDRDLKKTMRKSASATGEGGRGEDSSTADTVRIPVSRLDVLLNLVGELVIANSGLIQIQDLLKGRSDTADLNRLVSDKIKEIFRISGDIQELIMKSRLVPIGSVFGRFKRFVRDYSARSGKLINLEISGEETEIDKKIIDEMIKPLTHLVRNSVDHGIETPDKRAAKGKPEAGHLKLDAFQEGNYIYVVIEDDGNGLDYARILNKAVAAGIITRDAAANMRPDDIKDLIFHPGLSTKDAIDDISGRGIGMDIVKHSIQTLNGTLDLNSVPGKGTKVIIKLPLTLAIINALVVTISGEKFSIPMSSIVETQRISARSILMVEGNEMVRVRDTLIPLIRLDRILGLPEHRSSDAEYPIIIVEYNETLIGLLVDQFLSRHEMVIKSLAEHYRPIDGISGASILGNGEIILILDVHGIIQIYRKLNSTGEFDWSKGPAIISQTEEIRESEPEPVSKKVTETPPATPAQKPQPVASKPAETASEPEAPEENHMNKETNRDSGQMDPEKEALMASILARNSSSGNDDQGALSFIGAENNTESLKKLQVLFNPEQKELLKEWLRQGNYRAIQGIQNLTGSPNIRMERSKGRHISEKNLSQFMDDLRSSAEEMIDFVLPVNPIDGAVHFILTKENAGKIVKQMMDQMGIDAGDDLELEPLMEVTNILGSSYTNSLTHLTQVPVEPGVPLLLESREEMIAVIEEKISSDDFEILYVENKFRWDEQDVEADLLILIPEIKI